MILIIFRAIYGIDGNIPSNRLEVIGRTLYPLVNTDSNKPALTSLFEFLLRIIVFTPTPCQGKIRALFNMLWSLNPPNCSSPP
jgi:hypothetical protein